MEFTTRVDLDRIARDLHAAFGREIGNNPVIASRLETLRLLTVGIANDQLWQQMVGLSAPAPAASEPSTTNCPGMRRHQPTPGPMGTLVDAIADATMGPVPVNAGHMNGACCERAGEYNGFSSGALVFTCPKSCPCHD